MAASSTRRYDMSFSTGGLFLHESVELARLHLDGASWHDTQKRALSQGVTSLPKAASQQRTLREIAKRVACLSAEQRLVLVDKADRQEQQALLWLAVCRSYRFVREFAVDVLRERYSSWRLELRPKDFDTYYALKAEWDDGLAGLSASTRGKLRQVMYRIMREAGLLSSSDEIQGAYLSPRLRSLIEADDPTDLLIFPGVEPKGNSA